tara:strand:- start:518 stop:697 length:180 start_codon:yes stop_codon:yes gene_type:complete
MGFEKRKTTDMKRLKLVTANATSSQSLWFSRMGENRAANIYRPKRPTLRLVQKPKGQKQ